MAGYTLVITSRSPRLDPAALYPRGAEILSAFARVAQLEVQRNIWNHRMFVYRGLNPKPTTSRSELAWRGEASMSDLSISLVNDATNRRGKAYARYVHLAGRPKGEKLWYKVEQHLFTSVAPRMARAMSHDMITAAARVETRAIKVS